MRSVIAILLLVIFQASARAERQVIVASSVNVSDLTEGCAEQETTCAWIVLATF